MEKGMATHSSILAWEIPWTEEPSGLQSMGSQKSDTTQQLTLSLIYIHLNILCRNFPVAQTVKNLSVMQEIQVQSLGWEAPMEKGMATHSSILVWRVL